MGALGYKAKFSFKWIPDFANPTTPLGVTDQERHTNSGAFQKPGLERTALVVLVSTTLAAAFTAYAGVKAARTGLNRWIL
jgi:hypothetical protein